MTNRRLPTLFRAILVVPLFSVGLLTDAAAGTELLAHYEYECLSDTGCPQSSRTATEVNFEIAVYPDDIGFHGYAHGQTEDVTVPIEDFLVDFLASGTLAAPEPMEFLAMMVGAGGGGLSLRKADWRDGFQRAGPPVRVDAGYDVPLANGIDLQGTAIITELRFQLFDLEIFNSDVLPGSTMRSHYRYEFLGTLIPEPTAVALLLTGSATLVLTRRRM